MSPPEWDAYSQQNVDYMALSYLPLESQLFLHNDHGDAVRADLIVDDQYFVDTGARFIKLLHMDLLHKDSFA
jgi:hypothetical protein